MAQDAAPTLDRFYADLLHELDEFARRPSATAIGAAVVVKRVAKAHGVEAADRLPLPRFNRAERDVRGQISVPAFGHEKSPPLGADVHFLASVDRPPF
jgi:hypothetical protein